MAKKSAIALRKSDDTFHVYHRGYPAGGLLRFNIALGLSAALLAVPLSFELQPVPSQVVFAATCLLLVYTAIGYLWFAPFAALSGRVSFSPKEEMLTYTKAVLGKNTASLRQIPWDGKFEVETEPVGIPMKVLPLAFTRVKIVTDFMTYHVATFGPGLESTVEEFVKALKRVRAGRTNADAKAAAMGIPSALT